MPGIGKIKHAVLPQVMNEVSKKVAEKTGKKLKKKIKQEKVMMFRLARKQQRLIALILK